jgi:3-oxoacyl-(acyl-carrier-protein) synthase
MHDTRKIVVTGVSAISAVGTGLDAHLSGLTQPARLSTIKDTEFHSLDTETPCYRITDYEPKEVLGKKGLRLKDWSTKLLLGAVELGFKDFLEACSDEEKPGMCIGTAFGSVGSIGDFLSDSIVNGVDKVNPQAFANTVINAPTGNANIRYGIKTLSTTVATGFNASLDAFIYGCDFLKNGYLERILVGGLEEISYYEIMGMHRAGVLSSHGRARPFAHDGDGLVAGEGSAVFLLETEEAARKRGATILAEVGGYCSCFDPDPSSGEGARHAIAQALDNAGIGMNGVSFISADANGSPAGDTMEASVLAKMAPGKPVAAYKAKIGECYGASGALSIACALVDMRNGRIAGTGQKYAVHEDIALVSETLEGRDDDVVLVNNFSCEGNRGAIVLRKR